VLISIPTNEGWETDLGVIVPEEVERSYDLVTGRRPVGPTDSGI
jgi:hypothetical protein